MLLRIRKPFYGWYIVGMAFISLFIGAGTGGFAFGIFLPAMSAELGWSQSTIVIASSITSITAALSGPILGRIADRHGPRAILIGGLLLMFAGMAGSGFVSEPWHLYVTFGLMTGVARSGLQSVVPGTMISNWFIRRRSAAYGVAAMGPPCSNFLLPPVISAIVATQGWRAGWIAMGLQGILLGLLPALLIRRQRPEELGLQPDGAKLDPPPEPGTSRPSIGPTPRGGDWTAREATRSPAFWMVAAGMALVLLGPNVSIIFMFSYFGSMGISPTAAALAVSAVSGMQMLSRLVFWAPVSARIQSVRWLLVLWGSLMLGGTLSLAFAQGEIGALAAAALLGTGLGGNLVLQLQVWPEYFGRTALGTIIGTGSIMQGITAASVPLLLAVLLDHTGNYTLLYLITSGFVGSGLMLHIIVGKPRRPLYTA
ncbi:MAG: MFS transporter [Chloroflexota bacterium]